MKGVLKKSFLLMLCMSILLIGFPYTAHAAAEPGDGMYAVRNVATGHLFYYSVLNGQMKIADKYNGTQGWIIQNTAGSSKLFAMTPVAWGAGLALTFDNKDATAAITQLIPGYVGTNESGRAAFSRQRFKFKYTASGYFIQPLAFSDSYDNRVLEEVNGKIVLTKARGAKTQIFKLEWINSIS